MFQRLDDPVALAVQLVNTWDELEDPPELLRDVGVLSRVLDRYGFSEEAERATRADLDAARALRDRLRATFEVDDEETAVEFLNEILRDSDARPQLVPEESGWRLRWVGSSYDVLASTSASRCWRRSATTAGSASASAPRRRAAASSSTARATARAATARRSAPTVSRRPRTAAGAAGNSRAPCDHRCVANGRDGSNVVTMVGQLVGAAAGFVALLYVAGGGVLALRLYLADLPSRTIAAQLPRDLLISIALAQIVLPAAVAAGLYATWRLLRGATPAPTRVVRGRELLAVSTVAALAVVGLLWPAVGHVREGAKGLAWLVPIAFLVTLLAVLVGLSLRARLVDAYGGSARSWSASRAVVRMTLVVALVAVPICILFAGAYFPLLPAQVCTASGSSVTGVLIGETSDRTYVGEDKERGKLDVFSIPSSQTTQTIIGGGAAAGACPAQQGTR